MKAPTDEELAYWAGKGSRQAEAELVSRYEQICTFEAREYDNIRSMPLEDRIVECQLAVVQACRTYRAELGTPFKLWAKRLIRNRLMDLYRAHRARFHPVVEGEERHVLHIPLDTPIEGTEVRLEDVLASGGEDEVIEAVETSLASDWLGDPTLAAGTPGQPILLP